MINYLCTGDLFLPVSLCLLAARLAGLSAGLHKTAEGGGRGSDLDKGDDPGFSFLTFFESEIDNSTER